MSDEQDRILNKVRKLLAVGNDTRGNEQERETALRQAFALLAKHNLDIADVGSGENAEKREEQQARMSVYPWARGIAHAIAQLFFCAYYFQRGGGKTATHSFVGKTSNAVTAKEMSEYIVSNLFKELRTRFGSETSPEARSFAVGAETAIRLRCRAMREEAERASAEPSTGRSLVLASLYATEKTENEAWINAHVGKLVVQADRTKGVLSSAFRAGKEHGNKINLSRQIAGGTSRTKRLT